MYAIDKTSQSVLYGLYSPELKKSPKGTQPEGKGLYYSYSTECRPARNCIIHAISFLVHALCKKCVFLSKKLVGISGSYDNPVTIVMGYMCLCVHTQHIAFAAEVDTPYLEVEQESPRSRALGITNTHPIMITIFSLGLDALMCLGK